jgi:hypothetical protein
MLLAWGEPNNISRPDLIGRAARPLDPSGAGGDDQRLTERAGVPRSTGAGSKITTAPPTRVAAGAGPAHRS